MESQRYTCESKQLTDIGRRILRKFEDAHRFCTGETFPCVRKGFYGYGITQIGDGKCIIAYWRDSGRELVRVEAIYSY